MRGRTSGAIAWAAILTIAAAAAAQSSIQAIGKPLAPSSGASKPAGHPGPGAAGHLPAAPLHPQIALAAPANCTFSEPSGLAFYGFGRRQARDFPVTTFMNLVGARGRLASIFGDGGGDGKGAYVSADRRTLEWDIEAIAVAQLAELPAAHKALLERFVDGLNDERVLLAARPDRLDDNTAPLAFPEATILRLLARPVELVDVLCLGIHINGSAAMETARSLAADGARGSRAAVQASYSNSWSIAGAHTASGKPMIFADPHTPIEGVSIMRSYFAKIAGGDFDVAGISIPGTPCILIGFNASVAWTHTTNVPDCVDVWKAPLEADGASFKMDGRRIEIESLQRSIDVFDAATGTVVSETREIAFAGGRGFPVLRRGADAAGVESIWFAAGSFTSGPSIWRQFIDLNLASSVAEAMGALTHRALLWGNFLFVDGAGNRGYVASGRVPIRGEPAPGTTWLDVQDGSRALYRWRGLHAFADMPIEYVPADAAAAFDRADAVWINCNVSPQRTRALPEIDPARHPDYMTYDSLVEDSYRQVRAVELLRNHQGVYDRNVLERVAVDAENNWMRLVRPLLFAAASEARLFADPVAREALARLARWDLLARAEADEPVLAEILRGVFRVHLDEARRLGLQVPVESFDQPTAVPSPADFRFDPAWAVTRRALAAALRSAAVIELGLINPVLTEISFGPSAWTPAPFAALACDRPAWGTVLYLNLTAPGTPGDVAIYPLSGGPMCMMAFGAGDDAHSAAFIDPASEIFGKSGPFFSMPVVVGSHSMLIVEMTDPPTAHFLEAAGPTEIADDARRYRGAADFSIGRFRPFPADADGIAGIASR